MGVISGAAGLASGVLGTAGSMSSRQAKEEAAAQQAENLKKIAGGYGTLTQKQYGAISPYMKAGQGALTAQMQMIGNPLNRQAALSEYYASPEYAMAQDAANYATMAASEATGTTGNTATANTLAASATQLGQNYLNSLNKQRQGQMETLGDISQQGLKATSTMGGWAGQNYNRAAQTLAAASGMQGQATMQQGYQQALGMYGMSGLVGSASKFF